MSNLCKTQLCSLVQSNANSLDSTGEATDPLFFAFSVNKMQPTNRISDVVFDDLPAANTVPNGHVVYLDDGKVPVISSNGTWIGFDGRTIGNFNVNQIWSWGCNFRGTLADNTLNARCSPVREITSSSDWCFVSNNYCHVSALKTSGQLWTWGYGLCGSLGDNASSFRLTPVREITSSTDWCRVNSAFRHTLAIKTTGQLWGWGRNYRGPLGDGTNINRSSPVREICSATDWCQASGGNYTSAAIKNSGELWSWGCGACGRLGIGVTVNTCSPVREFCSATNWNYVSSGSNHTIAIKTDGTLWAWGRNYIAPAGALGDGTNVDKCSPVREISSSTNWCQISAKSASSAALKTTGELWVWGANNRGQIGDGTTICRCSPVREICSATDWCMVSTGGSVTAAVKTTGQIWTWGYGSQGRLGDGTNTNKCSPVREITSATNWCLVSTGYVSTSAIKAVSCICR